jgi:hypothetical protein
LGPFHRGWALSASGKTTEGIAWIEDGIRDLRATGAVVGLASHLRVKAEALYLADRTSEALEALSQGEVMLERTGERYSRPNQRIKPTTQNVFRPAQSIKDLGLFSQPHAATGVIQEPGHSISEKLWERKACKRVKSHNLKVQVSGEKCSQKYGLVPSTAFANPTDWV